MLHLPFTAGAGCSAGYGVLYTPLIPAYINVRQCQLSLNSKNTPYFGVHLFSGVWIRRRIILYVMYV